MKLKKMRDRIFDDKKICIAGTYNNATLWKLKSLTGRGNKNLDKG